jgi:two-component system, OmpR family, alkaline phosphatase synthesis response regulator PhoP
MKRRILIVEDNAGLASVLSDNLTLEGFEVRTVNEGNLAIAQAREFAPDLIILDVMLPGKSGFELCGLLRQGRRTPIIMLTARSQKADRILGLKLGADDYVTKPFDLEELLARVHAVLRRTRPDVERLELGHVTIDFRTLQAWDRGQPIELTHREFELLRYLAERQEVVVDRDELLREVWGYASAPNTRAVDQAVVRLRKKIEPDPQHPSFIHTVHGNGYCLTLQPQAAAKP